MIRIDDILAALFLSLIMFRRLEVLTIRQEDNTHVPAAKFQAWREMALSGYRVGAIACVAKVVLSLIWFQSFKERPELLAIGGLLVFGGWVIALVWGWRRTTEANAIRVELQLQRRPPPSRVGK